MHKTEVLLERDPEHDNIYMDEDARYVVRLPGDAVEDMGAPLNLTMTLEVGDKLNV